MVNFAHINAEKRRYSPPLGERVMIYTLAIILALLGAAVSAMVIITMWGAGTPVLRQWRRRPRRS
jgi:hypothetical protein